MEVIHFNFYDIGVSVGSSDPAAVNNIRRDFSYFLADKVAPADIRLTMHRSSPPYHYISGLRVSQRYGRVLCYDRGRTRYIDYYQKALAVCDYAQETVQVYSSHPDLLHEISYLLLHSRLGLFLDSRGLHRIHALGVAMDSRAMLFLSPSGGGKTSFGLKLLNDRRFQLLSDDTPLVRQDGMVLPFPIRIGIELSDRMDVPERFCRIFNRKRHGPKRLVDIEYFQDRIGMASPLSAIFICQRAPDSKAGIRPLSRLRAMWPYFLNGIMGYGVPQIKECVLKMDTDEIPRNLSLLARRALGFAKVIFRPGIFMFYMGPDPDKNYALLADHLYLDRAR